MNDSILNMERIIHLDLKSCPLKVDYLKKLFPLFKRWGGTGILVEWEDTFPYSDELVDIGSLSNTNVYSPRDVEELLDAAKAENLIVIPLVQTFGHLEFVLKVEKWRHLREVPKYVSSLCPSHPDSLRLVTTMITQIMNFHPDTKFLHVGGDEVWHLGVCEKCRQYSKDDLFLKHMLSVLDFVKRRYPLVIPIMWDDMLRNINVNTLKDFNIGKYVEPMIWEYRRAETFSLSTDMWEKYSDIFPIIWIASAFKGAISSCQVYPIAGNYVNNHEKWLSVLAEIYHKFKTIRGVALTGWSRFDHYATLCELMPCGLISLALCLKTMTGGKYDDDTYNKISFELGFQDETPLILYPVNRPVAIAKSLNFPGYEIYRGIEWFENVRAKFNFVAYSDQAVTWLNAWHLKRNHTSTMQVEHIIVGFKTLFDELNGVEQHLKSYLPEAYYDDTIEEWLGCYLHPLKDKLADVINSVKYQ